MPANFSNLQVKFTHQQTGESDLVMFLNLTSLNFDINQATLGPNTPFTSELNFQVNFENNSNASFFNFGELKSQLDAHFVDFDNSGVLVDEVSKIFKQEIFLHDHLGIEYLNIDDSWAAPADLIMPNSNAVQALVASSNPDPNEDIFSLSWAVKLKFPAQSPVIQPQSGGTPIPLDSSIVLYPQFNFDVEEFELLGNSESYFNNQLQLNYELLYVPETAAGSNLGTQIAGTLGKATDELTDSISSLSSSLSTNLSSTFTTRLQPPGNYGTEDLALWVLIKKGTDGLRFDNYDKYMRAIFCGEGFANASNELETVQRLNQNRSLPFMNIDAYKSIKVATEAFVMVNCMVDTDFTQEDMNDLISRVPLVNGNFEENLLNDWWRDYTITLNGGVETIPYLAAIRRKLGDEDIRATPFENAFREYIENGNTNEENRCYGILSQKLSNPCFLELIWSYWHEESMMVQGLNAISHRFQNVRGPGAIDPLANLEIDPLRPLNNLMWGYIQDEQHRLTVRRRAYEYNHHYGITLKGNAAKNMRFADSRSKFIEAFHTLLNIVSRFYRQADDMTVNPDGFPVLNALKEVHLILSEGAHNQYGDLPSTARAEMLAQQWMLARPEFREFLPTRVMVAYPEPWMDRVAAMNNLMNWTKSSVLHFSNLGYFGEQLLLSIRFGHWSEINDRRHASNWANFWREQIQGYIHAYRTVTGVDLSSENRSGRIDYQQPSFHLYRKLKEQQSGKKIA